MNYKPVGDKVLIERVKQDVDITFQSSSGLYIVSSQDTRHKGRISLGIIKALGTRFIDQYGTTRNQSEVFKEGDKVIYYHPSEVVIDETNNLVLVRAIDIDAIVSNDCEVSLR